MRLSRTARVYSHSENRNRLIDLFLRDTFIACADFSRNRFTATNGLPAAKWARRSCLADFERTLWSPDRAGFFQDSGKRTKSLFESVWQDRRFPGKYRRGGRRRGHGGAAWRKIYSGANALFHAIHRRRRHACWIFTWLSGVARLCSDARTLRDCILQCSQRWHSRHGARKNSDRAVSRAIRADISVDTG